MAEEHVLANDAVESVHQAAQPLLSQGRDAVLPVQPWAVERVHSLLRREATAKKILAHLGFTTEPIVARPRARDPAEFWASTPSMVE